MKSISCVERRSAAGESTCIVLYSAPGVVFDLGGQFRDAANKDTVFVSHSHMDHISALPWHSSYRAMLKQHPPTYIVPHAAHDGLLTVLAGHAMLSEKPDAMECNLTPVGPEHMVLLQRKVPKGKATHALPAAAADAVTADTHADLLSTAQQRFQGHPTRAVVVPADADLGQYTAAQYPHFVRIHATEHRVPSHAHVLYSRHKSYPAHLLGEGEDLGTAIKEGRLQPEITTKPVLAVSGDTIIDSILQCPDACAATVLVLECTYLEDTPKTSIDKCRERGHVHLHEFAVSWASGAFTNSAIVLTHMSTRYGFHQAKGLVRDALAAALKRQPGSGTGLAARASQLPQVHVHCPGTESSQTANGSKVKLGGSASAGGDGSQRQHHGQGGQSSSGGGRRGGAHRGGGGGAGGHRGGAWSHGRGGRQQHSAAKSPGKNSFERWSTKRAPGDQLAAAAGAAAGAGDNTKRPRGPHEGAPQGD